MRRPPGETGMPPASMLRVRTVVVGLVAVLVVLLSGCADHSDWVEFRGDGGRGQTRNEMQPPLGIRWRFALQSNSDAFAFNNLVVKDDSLYFGSTDGNFYSMSIETGYMNWVHRTDAPVNSVPVVDDERVYFGSNDGYLYAVNRESGEEAWTYRAGRPVQSTVVTYEDTIVFGIDGVGVQFLSRSDGEPVHSIDNPIWLRVSLQVDDDIMYIVPGPPENPRSLGVYNIPESRHQWLLPDEVMAATWYSFPAVNDERLFTQTSHISDGRMRYTTWALDREDGQVEWRREFDADFAGNRPENLGRHFRSLTRILDYQAPAIRHDQVISANGDNVLRAFNEATGEIEWETHLSNRTSSAPMISGDLVFVGIHGDDPDDRQPSGAPLSSSGTATARGIQLAGEQGTTDRRERNEPRLAAFSAHSGRKVWELETDGAVLSPPVVAGRHMVFGTDENVVYVLERVFG
ncbi:MAG: PQQ-binding-like beta-propeller repeat protein [bacterium]